MDHDCCQKSRGSLLISNSHRLHHYPLQLASQRPIQLVLAIAGSHHHIPTTVSSILPFNLVINSVYQCYIVQDVRVSPVRLRPQT